MAKDTFAAHGFRADTFASGTWTGVAAAEPFEPNLPARRRRTFPARPRARTFPARPRDRTFEGRA
jgi:hypothetical protein